MNKEERKVPELRFKGFHDDWEQREINDVAEVRTGPFGSVLHASDYIENGIPIITTEHFKTGRLPKEKTDIPQVSNEDYLRLQSYLLQVGDIVFSRVGSIDKNALVTTYQEGWLFSGRVLRARPFENIKSYFLNFLLDTTNVKRSIISRAVGQTMPSINTEILKKTPIKLTVDNEEQLKIGAFINKLDINITLHQRKINILLVIKKAYFNAVFPLQGENIPNLRFNSFNKEWEQRQVSDLSKETFGGGTPKTSKKEYWSGNIPWIQSSDLKLNDVKSISVNKFITKVGLENSAAKLIPKNSLAIVTRVGVGKVALIPFDYTTSQDFLSLSNLNVNNNFGLFLMYNTLQKELLALQGTSIKGITKKEILKKSLRVPKSLHEQDAIGRTLNNIEKYITIHQNKLEILTKLKQVYLNKMFI